MDQNIKKKINTLGTVGNVLAILSRIAVIAGIVVLMLIGIAGLILPRDAVKVSMGGTMEIQVSEKLYEGRFPVVSNLEDADFDFDGQEYESVKISIKENLDYTAWVVSGTSGGSSLTIPQNNNDYILFGVEKTSNNSINNITNMVGYKTPNTLPVSFTITMLAIKLNKLPI